MQSGGAELQERSDEASGLERDARAGISRVAIISTQVVRDHGREESWLG
jgi:hypothetical protein